MKAAFVAYDGCALWQVTLLQMFLHNAEISMDTLTIDGNDVVSDGGLVIRASTSVHEVRGDSYDLCFMAGGDITVDLLCDERMQRFIQSVTGWVAASCASVAIAGAAGRLSGTFTCLPHTKDMFAQYLTHGQYSGEDVCVDAQSRLITSKGYAHYDFMMAVLSELGLLNQDPRLAKMAIKLSKNLPA